jgi:hypothetical protein
MFPRFQKARSVGMTERAPNIANGSFEFCDLTQFYNNKSAPDNDLSQLDRAP